MGVVLSLRPMTEPCGSRNLEVRTSQRGLNRFDTYLGSIPIGNEVRLIYEVDKKTRRVRIIGVN
ncbi:MAG: hypothetical protein IH845_01030, partial [Nanoarchaeota archaeon]|nr:hypothetical protein [Nanoarchaeota archaeon]